MRADRTTRSTRGHNKIPSGGLEGGAKPNTPSNAYVAENGTTYYVAENGTTYYVQES